MTENRPPSTLTVTLHPLLGRLAEPGAGLVEEVQARHQRLLDDLGVPARAVARVGTARDPSGDWAEIRLDGRVLRAPTGLLARVRDLVEAETAVGTRADDGGDRHLGPADRLGALLDREDDGARRCAVRFCVLSVSAVLGHHLPELLGAEQAAAYARLLPAPATRWDVRAVVRPLLAAKVSVADTRRVGEILADDGGTDAAAVSEALLAALRPDALAILLPPDHLRELTAASDASTAGVVTFLREGLFEELGVWVPPLGLVPDPGLPPRSSAVRVNDWTGVPRAGLAAGEHLVHATPEHAADLGLPVLRYLQNPAADMPNVVVPRSAAAQAEASGLTGWDPLQHLVLAVAAALREDASCFVDRRSVRQRIDVLRRTHPHLVRQAVDEGDLDEVVRVVRALVAEGVSVRNLPPLLERLLDARLAGRPADSLPFVRSGLTGTIAAQYTSGRTLRAYLVDPAIEAALRDGPVDDAVRGAILGALRTETDLLPPGARLPVLLTDPGVRPRLRAAVATEFPDLPVLAYDELPADVLVQPLARVSLADAAVTGVDRRPGQTGP